MAAQRRVLRELRSLIAPIVGQEAADKLVGVLGEFDGERLTNKADMARIGERFDEVDRRFEQVDQRFDEVDRRFEQVDRRFDEVDHRFEALEGQMRELRYELLAAFRGELVTAVSGQTRMMLLGMLGAVVTMAGAAVGFARLL